MADQKCEALFKEEKYSELKAYCEERLSVYAGEKSYTFYYALALAALGEYEEAIQKFTYLYNKTSDLFYLICRAWTYFLAGEGGIAMDELETIIKEDENYADLVFIFMVAIRSGDINDAKNAIAKAFRKKPDAVIEEIRKFFEQVETASNEERILFVRIIDMLNYSKNLLIREEK